MIIEDNNKLFDYVIVGAGLAGAVFAYLATQKGKKCLVIDKRNHIGGNLYCDCIYGINVHRYGAHIFHTSNKEVWDFVNGLVEFNRYTNSPIAIYGDKAYNLPFNMNTFNELFGITNPDDARAMINKEIVEYQMENGEEKRNLKDQAISMVGTTIYELLIKDYTEKQWGRKCEDLPPEIIKRLPLRFTYDNNYFNDKYQGIPIGGYNVLIDKLLEGSMVSLGKDYFAEQELYDKLGDKIVFTGKIDEFYKYCYGELEYRTVYWDTKTMPISNFQGNAVVNYTKNDVPYTRVIEYKHFEKFNNEVYDSPNTVVAYEYSTEWKDGMECFYPVNDEKNTTLYNKYKELSNNDNNVIFIGRLAEYKYYDMDDIIENILSKKDLI